MENKILYTISHSKNSTYLHFVDFNDGDCWQMASFDLNKLVDGFVLSFSKKYKSYFSEVKVETIEENISPFSRDNFYYLHLLCKKEDCDIEQQIVFIIDTNHILMIG